MNWFANNVVETLLILGVVLLIIEVLVLGFSTFFLFFAGLSALLTAIIVWMGIIPDSFLSILISMAIFTAAFATALWKPLEKMQSTTDNTRPKSDIIGHRLILPSDLNATDTHGLKYQYSGLEWELKAETDLLSGQAVEVFQTDVGVLWVKRVEQ